MKAVVERGRSFIFILRRLLTTMSFSDLRVKDSNHRLEPVTLSLLIVIVRCFRSAGPRHVLRPNGLDRLQILGLGWSFLCRLALCCHRLAPISPRSPAGCCKSKTGNWLFYPPALFIAFHCKFPSELASFALSLLAILQDHHLQNQRPQLPQASERKSFVGETEICGVGRGESFVS